jgi:hypothetical protein
MVLACGTGVKVRANRDQAQMTDRPLPDRSLRWRAYRLVRPVVRPVAWRLRSFFMGALQDEMSELRAQIEALRLELRERAAREDAALEPRIAAVMEQALLTLALDRQERPLALGRDERRSDR